jgi:5-methylcytosine-specific restriction endonuclease McrA
VEKVRGGKFCSRECSAKYFSIKYKGAGGSNWKGGITPHDKQQRRIFMQSVRKSVFERDDYTCQLCGIRGGNLQVDHIQSWAEYIDLRFNMDNCRTLCMECHYKITFGKPKPDSINNWGNNFKKGVKDGIS